MVKSQIVVRGRPPHLISESDAAQPRSFYRTSEFISALPVRPTLLHFFSFRSLIRIFIGPLILILLSSCSSYFRTPACTATCIFIGPHVNFLDSFLAMCILFPPSRPLFPSAPSPIYSVFPCIGRLHSYSLWISLTAGTYHVRCLVISYSIFGSPSLQFRSERLSAANQSPLRLPLHQWPGCGM